MYFYNALTKILRVDKFFKYVILEPKTLEKDLQQFEAEFSTPFPQPLAFVLEHWTAGNNTLLLETLPALLNPTATPNELIPTGRQSQELFPELYQMVNSAEQIGVVAYIRDATEPTIDYLLIGLAVMPQSSKSGIIWAYYVPQRLEWIMNWEKESGIVLSPQLKQMYLRCNGNMNCYPHFYPLEGLYLSSLAELYAPLWAEVLSPEPFERLERFVTVTGNGFGDEYGFFPDGMNTNGEYPFFMWDHEKACFIECADDFANFWYKISAAIQKGNNILSQLLYRE